MSPDLPERDMPSILRNGPQREREAHSTGRASPQMKTVCRSWEAQDTPPEPHFLQLVGALPAPVLLTFRLDHSVLRGFQ